MKFGLHSTQNAPHIASLHPQAALPGGEVELHGRALVPHGFRQPVATVGEERAPVTMSQAARVLLLVPPGAISGNVQLRVEGHASNALPLSVGVPIAEKMDPVANPVADADGNVYVTFSGHRGEQTPVSVFQIDTEYQLRPFATGILNATGLALDAEGNLYVSSRHEGTVYRVTPSGAKSIFAEGMGVATGLAFDKEGVLYVGDRSGTIFKITQDRQVFVFATLEPSVAAYHLAFTDAGALLVSGPTTSANETIHAIEPDGGISSFYSGLGRPQGMALDVAGNVYVAASLQGRRGVVKITPEREASLAISGSGVVGLAFLPEGDAVLATRDTVYHVGLDVIGRLLH
ncbi:MAG: NHL repeat-containing protein [Acidobacteriaceae bacterium]